ncbi:factor in the germline alpha isoform X2 [Leucoraja erinacea]|uniref:factor in the germline alpha isoform X2 n=1 Tax=Leucoraja erinaceus TaxID=7782 RepID=UPI0024546245|nr:factor in the germline alpha isoform X2 [Leucoraja erinacea]
MVDVGMERGKDMKHSCYQVAFKKLQDCELLHQEEAVEGVCPQLILVPEAERMNEVLGETFGPLPLLAPVRKFKRQSSGHYTSKDVQDLFGKRRAANARERSRIQSINGGFSMLKSVVPLIAKDRKPSKVHVLRAASEYIRLLHIILEESGGTEIADNNNNSLLPNLGESQLLVNNVPSGSNLAMHLPHQQEDQVQSHLQPLVYEDTHDVWDNGVMPFLGIVQLHDDSLVIYSKQMKDLVLM